MSVPFNREKTYEKKEKKRGGGGGGGKRKREKENKKMDEKRNVVTTIKFRSLYSQYYRFEYNETPFIHSTWLHV